MVPTFVFATLLAASLGALTATAQIDPAGPTEPTGGTVSGTAAAAEAPRIRIIEQTPWVEPDGDFVLRVTVDDPPPGATLDLTLHGRLTGRIQFAEGIADEPRGAVVDRRCGTLVGGAVTALDPCRIPLDDADLDDDGATTIVVPVRAGDGPADRVRLTADGVYPVRLVLADEGGAELTSLVTHLLRAPDDGDDSPPLDVGVVIPLVAPLATRPDGTVDLPTDAHDELAGRVRVIAEHPDVPLVLAPRAETLEALADADDTLLAAIREVAASSQILTEPYVDIDLASWWADGALDPEVTELLALGARIEAELLGTTPDSGTWQVGPTTDPANLARLVALGVEQVVVPSELLPELDEALFPIALDRPFEITAGDGTRLPAVLDDAELRAHIGATGDPQLDAHHLLADLALLYSQQPGIPRGVAFSLDEEAVDPAFLDTLLDGLGTSPFLRATTVDDLLATAEPARADGSDSREGETLVRPVLTTDAPGLGTYPERRREAELALEPYRSLAVDDSGQALADHLILVSGSRELDEAGQQAYLDGAVDQLADLATGVVVPDQGRVTLTAREGRIPIVLHNERTDAVRVLVRLESPKLDFPEGDEQEIALDPGETRIEWLVRTRASGAFPVEVSVWSPDRSLRLDETRFTMRSTAVPGIGIALSALAAVFLAVWWARHWHTTRRATGLVDSGATDAVDVTVDHDRVLDEITNV